MKKIFAVAYVLLITVSLSFTSKITVNENTMVATFKGVTDDDYYKFIDENKKEVLFYDVNEEIELSLYDEEFIGSKFTISWEEKSIELVDEDGEFSGETKVVKSIIALEQLK